MSGLRVQTALAGLRLATVAILATQAAPIFAQRLGQGTGTEVPILRVIFALALCLALAVGAAFVLKRRLGGLGSRAIGRTRRLQLVESLRLSHQVDLCIVDCDGGEFIVAATPHGATLINAGPLAHDSSRDGQ